MEEHRKIMEADFAFEVPTDWEMRSEESGDYNYYSPDKREHVSIRIARFKVRQSSTVLRAIVQEAIDSRLKIVAEMSKGFGMLLPTANEARSEEHIVELVGSDPINRTLMFVRFVATPARLVTISAYRYGDGSDPKGFTALAEKVSRSLRVRETQEL